MLAIFISHSPWGRGGVLRYEGRFCVPNVDGMRNRIVEEAHGSRYSIHLGLTKMYHELSHVFWWDGLKKDITDFVASFLNCQKVKAEHQMSGRFLQVIRVPTWKWEDINMDFIVGLPRTRRQYDSIWMILDRLTKSTHFFPIKTTYSRIFIYEIVCCHGIPLCIISDWGAQFISILWKSFQEGLGTKVKLSTAFNPQTDAQAECTIQTLEDILEHI